MKKADSLAGHDLHAFRWWKGGVSLEFALMARKQLARPLPNANMLMCLPLRSAGSTEDDNNAKST